MNGRMKNFGLVLVGAVAGVLVSLNFQAVGQLATRSPLPVEELRSFTEVFGGFYTPKIFKKFNVKDATNAGFTVLKKLGKGEYEKHTPKRNDPGASVKSSRSPKKGD